ncbi:MAG: Unknown protein [uncultured Sulfurovum sp.]|uniref:Uncharacterized protein n=1 Tax=uncultured Sulfurovum sp. TaxID=269237 RepID=A0A6S6TPY0_9BACT|nr:MAG: Unknown protein [uncultured Sulfurovum sp.]
MLLSITISPKLGRLEDYCVYIIVKMLIIFSMLLAVHVIEMLCNLELQPLEYFYYLTTIASNNYR